MVIHRLLQLTFALVAHAATINGRHEASTVTRRSAVLYQNDGNWTTHAETPSSILFFNPISLSEARQICAENSEALLHASDLDKFKIPLQYQTYLGNTGPKTQFWTASSSDHSFSETRTFICTNTAPLVDKVETPFYLFPKVNVSSNGSTYIGVRDHIAYRFLGIPYILQPVGDLRLAYPIQWYTNETDHVLNATTYGPTCPANGGFYDGNSYGLNPWGNSEACVLMNIFTPYLPGSENPSDKNLKPVLFWLHGGGSTAMDATYDGVSLASRSDVVIVSINWRGGNFGTLSFDDGYVDGNYGIADIVTGLQWVQDHIKAFGGDPKKVTIFGQSAGGESVVNMIRSPKAAGLFSGAIVQSGALGPAYTQDEIANVTVPAVAAVCGNSTGAARLSCLRSLGTDEFMNNITWSIGHGYANFDNGAIIDGIWIANQTVAAARNGQLNRVHYMAGSMPEEGESLLGTAIVQNATDFNATLYSIVGPDIPVAWPPLVEKSGLWNNGTDPINAYNNTINAYTTAHLTCPGEQFIQAAHEANAFKSYYYYNNLRAYALSYYDPYTSCTFPVDKPNTPYYRCHSGDIYQVFGTYYIFDQPIRTAADIGHTNLQQDMWGAFARTGDPNPAKEYLRARGYTDSLALFEKFHWPEFNGRDSMNIDFPEPFISDLPWKEKCGVVEQLFQLP
ncbi:uncharacterized protein TRUGW13939_00788 [Talaromyces rugulosus]|uniref:Carboxylic ester hydrolase n=1 Tax=Talaromyces rugulosus TaxID=121627 RepID=A0A7H8QID0_TALRU|nr:uncharacterized protein TRUGW13939_00788 [Talaromyces rugulosus]QKX53708.1 hypothetical protein TRUGW13939_00788 [Talaromyces rugulosus]